MIVTIKTPNDEQLAANDYRGSLTIEIDGKRVASFWDGEPEDNTISRNFNDVHAIPSIITQAYEAGARGEFLTFQNEDED